MTTRLFNIPAPAGTSFAQGFPLLATAIGWLPQSVLIDNYSNLWLYVTGAENPFIPPAYIGCIRNLITSNKYADIHVSSPFVATQTPTGGGNAAPMTAGGAFVQNTGPTGYINATYYDYIQIYNAGSSLISTSNAGSGTTLTAPIPADTQGKIQVVSIGNTPTLLPNSITMAACTSCNLFNIDTAKTIYWSFDGSPSVAGANSFPLLPQAAITLPYNPTTNILAAIVAVASASLVFTQVAP